MLIKSGMELEKGAELVKTARKAIECYLRDGRTLEPGTSGIEEEKGVFVTLKTYPKGELRGCIGHPEPTKLLQALIDSAISAATRDPRFPPVLEDELEGLTIEVTILSKPERINVSDPKEYLEKIKIGRDGLIIEKSWSKGLLLPIVPVEYSWAPIEFLQHTCMKAGLEPDAWQDKETKVYSFRGELFSEDTPKGKIIKVSSS